MSCKIYFAHNIFKKNGMQSILCTNLYIKILTAKLTLQWKKYCNVNFAQNQFFNIFTAKLTLQHCNVNFAQNQFFNIFTAKLTLQWKKYCSRKSIVMLTLHKSIYKDSNWKVNIAVEQVLQCKLCTKSAFQYIHCKVNIAVEKVLQC